MIVKLARYGFYGLLFSLCVGCAQKTGEEKVAWLVEKMERELKLNVEQKNRLRVLGQGFMAAQTRLAGEHSWNMARWFEGGVYRQGPALAELDRRWEEFRRAAEDISRQTGEFYDSLDDEQKQRFRTLLEEHRHRPGRLAGWKGRHWHDRS